MRISQSLALTTLAAVAALSVAGCASESDDAPADHANHADHADHGAHGGHDHPADGGHDHPADGGPAPAGIAEATDPTYPVGTEVTLTADHMPGMDGATATTVSYTHLTLPTTPYV